MEKIVVRRPGNFDRLQLVAEADLRPADGQVIVRTASIGVNFADCVVRMGLYPSATELIGWPITPGFEFSGVVENVGAGDNPQGLKVGDEVFGVALFGAYATLVQVPFSQLHRVPTGVSLVNAGVISVAALTALYALEVLGAAKPGSNVLIHSAAGGVGSSMVQIAKLLGARVVGVVGASEKVASVTRLGADEVIDKSQGSLFGKARELCPQGYDLVLDANGFQTMKNSYKALRPTGRLILYGAHTMLSRGSGRRNWLKLGLNLLRTPRFDPLTLINENKSVMAFNLSYLFDEKGILEPALEKISNWYAEGALQFPAIEQYALSDVASAHRALQSGTTVGKLTLIP